MKIRRWFLRGLLAFVLLTLIVLAISALVNRNLPTQSETVDHLGEAEQARLVEFVRLRQALGDRVWPGWGSAHIPLVVYNESYAFLLGYPDPPDGWVKVPQNELRGGAWEVLPGDLVGGESYYRQVLPASGETPEAFTVLVGQRWVASMPTREWMEIGLIEQFQDSLPTFLVPVFPYPLMVDLFLRGSEGYISLVAHESFHAFQGTVASERLAAAEIDAFHSESRYPWYDPLLKEAWQSELELLAQAVQAESEVEVRGLAQQFLIQRGARHEQAGLSSEQISYERQREWLEGLARYVELEIWKQASLAADYEPTPSIVDDPDFSGYGTFERRWSQEIDQIGRMADDEGDGRFYYSGMAQAVLLDRLVPEWKSDALDEDIFLEDLLSAALNPIAQDR